MPRCKPALSAGLIFSLALALSARPGSAQARSAGSFATSPSIVVADSGTALRHHDLWVVGVASALAVAFLPLDTKIADAFRHPGPQGSQLLHRGAGVFNALGGSGALIFGVGAYGVGRVTRARGVAALGLHVTEAIVLGGTATSLLKGIAGRRRPSVDQNDSDEFALGRGFTRGGLTSFPSGHTSAAFAAASVITSELGRSSPGRARIVGPLLYGAATMVGLARVYDNKHWASDVAVGAGIGTLSGLRVVRYAYAHPRNRIERWMGVAAVPTIMPSAQGVVVAWHLTTR